MGPVFLFNMGIVVLFIRAGTGELNRLALAQGEILIKMIIDKLTAVIGIESSEGER